MPGPNPIAEQALPAPDLDLASLPRAEARLAQMLDAIGEGFWDWSVQTGEVCFSPAWMRSLGYSLEEVPSHVNAWQGMVHPDDITRVRQALQDHLEGRTPIYHCENRLRTKSGLWRWNLSRGKVVEWDPQGRPLRMVGADTDINEHKKVEGALLDSEAQLRAFLESASQGLVAVNGAGRIEMVNVKTEEMFGYTRDQLLGQPLELLLPKRLEAIHRQHRERYFSAPGSRPMGAGLDLAGRRKNGEEFAVEIGLSYIRTKDGILAMGLITDITERKQADDALRASEQRLRLMVDNLPAGAVYVEGESLFVNRTTEELTGYRRAELPTLDAWFRALYGDNRQAVRQLYEADREAGFPAPRTVALTRKDGQPRFVQFAAYRSEQGDVWLLHDVTELRLAEEKATLLKEIHHRVKNNLQVVSSLLGLQSRSVPDPQTRRMLQESQNRVHSMALLHERLYQSDNLADIDCQEYFQQLASHLFRSYGVSSSRVKLVISFDDIRMSLDTAVPCGLVVNELLSNCLKHAFPAGREGEIRVWARKNAERKLQLAVVDNGIGLPEDMSLWSARSLGLRLVRTLAEQLGATVEVNSGPGTEVRLTFPAAAEDHGAVR